jgi:hypothetical protein
MDGIFNNSFCLILLRETYDTVIGHLAAAAANSMVECLFQLRTQGRSVQKHERTIV